MNTITERRQQIVLVDDPTARTGHHEWQVDLGHRSHESGQVLPRLDRADEQHERRGEIETSPEIIDGSVGRHSRIDAEEDRADPRRIGAMLDDGPSRDGGGAHDAISSLEGRGPGPGEEGPPTSRQPVGVGQEVEVVDRHDQRC